MGSTVSSEADAPSPSLCSDNGFEANGGHRRHPGKTLPYEEDVSPHPAKYTLLDFRC